MDYKHNPHQLDAFYKSGFELIKLHKPEDKDGRGRPVGKAPIGARWRTAAALSVIEAQALMDEGFNIGVRLTDAQLVVDVDRRNFPEGDDPFKRLQDDLGVDFESQYPGVVTGSGGFHYYMRKDPRLVIRDSLEGYQGVEFKSIGRQVVAPGSVHPTTLQTYIWDPLGIGLPGIKDAPPALLEMIKRPERVAAVDAGGVSPEELEKWLACLDPCDYADHTKWLEMMMASHHATAGEGRDEFIAWSTSDPIYRDEGWSIGRRWDSLHADGSGKRVTKRFIFKEVKNAGHGHILPARENAADDFPDLDGDDVQAEDFSHIDEGSAGAYDMLEWVNAQGYCTVYEEDTSVYRLVPDIIFGKDGRTREYWKRTKAAGFRLHFSNRRIQQETTPGKFKTVELGDAWLKWGGRNAFDGIIFDPSGRMTPKKGRFLNTWMGWMYEPKKGSWGKLKQLILEGLCAGNVEGYEYVLKWMAFMVQKPEVPAEVAIVFKGAKGTGKSTLGNMLMALCGRHGMQISSQHHFTSHFNAHMRDCIFLFADEAMWAGDKKAEGELKRLITEEYLQIEAKGVDATPHPNMLHVMMASNESWVVPASLGDERRFAIFEVSQKFRGQHEFFEELRAEMKAGGYEAMLWDLKAMDLTGYHPRRNIPHTDALIDQQLASLDPIGNWWYRCLQDGSIGFAPVFGTTWGPGENLFSSKHMLESFEQYMHKHNEDKRSLARRGNELGKRLNELIPKLDRRRVAPPNDRLDFDLDLSGRIYAYVVPSLKDCREHFEKILGGRAPWETASEPEIDPLS